MRPFFRLRDFFGPEALAGIEDLSHVEVLFNFHLHADEPVETGARHPRDRADWPKVGIFALRGRMRPNRIGLSTCRVVGSTEPRSTWKAAAPSTARRCSTSSRCGPATRRSAISEPVRRAS